MQCHTIQDGATGSWRFHAQLHFRAAAIDEGAVEDAAAAGDLERASAVAGSFDADEAAAAA